ncbi:MAG: GYD domain-containing protein [Candidatus Dormiibacterota bacterium]
MPLYLYEAAYTAESLAAQIAEPKDRIEVVRPLFEAVGGHILASGYPFGDYDVLVIYEAADDTVAASLALAVGAGGAVRSARTTRLLTGEEWVDSLRKAQGATPAYRPAR